MTPRERARWRALSPHHRHLLTSHRPDDMERDANLSASIATALENVYGPRVWAPALARVAEGEDDGDPWPRGPEYAMTLTEIGDELGVSCERVRRIIETALGKLRHLAFSRAHRVPSTWNALDAMVAAADE